MSVIEEIFDITAQEVENNPQYVSEDWIEEPPSFDDYITSGQYIDIVQLSESQHSAVVDVIGNDPKKIFSPDRRYSLGILCIGKGGGKDWLIAILMSWIVTVLLHLRNPQKYLQIDGKLDLLNVATKGKQADDIFFTYFSERIKQNRWLLKHFKIYDSGVTLNKCKDPYDVISMSGSSLIAKKKGIRCFAESSNNESWEGYNVIFFVLDEISGFISEKKVENGWAIYNTAMTSCISRRTPNFKGLGYVISYPRQEKNDIILDLYRKSLKAENSHMYGMFRFAWQFKPIIPGNIEDSPFIYYDTEKNRWRYKTFKFSSKRLNRIFKVAEEKSATISIPISYKESFDENPEDSMTKYCCLPPRQAGDYIEYPERIFSCIDQEQKRMFVIEDIERIEEVNGEVFKYLTKRIIACTEVDPDVRHRYQYVAWLDAAEKHCDAVIAIARREKITYRDETGFEVYKDICRVVDIINWIPEPGRAVDLVNVENFLVTELRRYINLREVGADQWESATLANKLISAKIKATRFNLSGDHYNVAKGEMYKGNVLIFDEEPDTKKDLKELTSLEQLLSLKNGVRGPEKKEGLKKDKSDAIVGVINLLLGNLFTKKNKPMNQRTNRLPEPIQMGKSKQGAIPRADIEIRPNFGPPDEKRLPRMTKL